MFGFFYLAQCPPHSVMPSHMEYRLHFQGCIIFHRLFSHTVIYSYIATQAHATATVNSPAVNTGCRDLIPNFIVLKFSRSQSNFFFNFLRTLHTVFYNSIYLPINCAQKLISSPTLGICCGLSPSGLVPLWLRGGRNSKKAVGRGGSE